MRKVAPLVLVVLVSCVLAPTAFAQEGAAAPAGGASWLAISGAFGMALAAAGCGIAQSRVASAACESIARNPGATAPIRAAMFLGLVFVETLALFTLVVIFTLIFR